MDAKTFWVSRDEGDTNVITVYPVRPTPWRGGWDASNGSDVWADHYAALGLPQEPAPGECWEVRWTELRPAGPHDDPVMVPIARNVTEELKGQSQ